MKDYSNHPLSGAKDLDSAMSLLWSFYKNHFLGLYLISVISAIASNIITASMDLTGFTTSTDPLEIIEQLRGLAGPYALLILVSYIFGIVLHAYVLERPVTGDLPFGTILGNSAAAFIPYLLVVILLGMGGIVLIGIGIVLLVLPGLFAAFYFITVIIFALPVTLAESRNPVYIISRTFQLAHKNFWANMGWVIVIILIMMVISLVIAGLIMLPFTGTFIKSIANPEEAEHLLEMARNPIYIGLSSITSALVTPVFPILAFILYFRNSAEVSQSERHHEDEGRVRVEDLFPKMPEKD